MTDHYECPRCAEWVPLTEQWCPECDAPLTLDAQLEYRRWQLRENVGPRLFTCPVCLVDTGDNVCPHCGRRLTDHDFDPETNDSADRQKPPLEGTPVGAGGSF